MVFRVFHGSVVSAHPERHERVDPPYDWKGIDF